LPEIFVPIDRRGDAGVLNRVQATGSFELRCAEQGILGLMTATSLRTGGRVRLFCTLWLLAAASGLSAAGQEFTPYASVKGFLPRELGVADEAQWLAWSRREDKTIRARLEQGDRDSVANLLLFGTSFTKQPRIRMDRITEASKAGVLRARVDDLVAGLRNPGNNERLLFVQKMVRERGINPLGSDPQQPGLFLFNNLMRVVQERITLGDRVAHAGALKSAGNPNSLLDRASVFRDRGVSLDTGILPNFLIEQALIDLKKRGILREGQATRVAVVGPGLDFIDKNEDYAYDYYPQQTVQPFALYDSLIRLRLAKEGDLSVSVLDISSRVIEHIQRARDSTALNGYVVQLPREGRPWSAELTAYWRSLGDQVGSTVAPIPPPEIFQGLETRAVRIRPQVVRSLEPVDLNIVLERLNLSPHDAFDLIVGTNIFVYYDKFQQTLALENAGAMLKPTGLLLTNDRLPEAPGGLMRLGGITTVPDPGAQGRTPLAVGRYQKIAR
jgi:hypothetical protein